MATPEDIGQELKTFIQQNFIFDESADFGVEESLIGSGIVDSTGIMELITFVEDKYGLHIEDNELIADNFSSVAKISNFVVRKLSTEAVLARFA